MITRERLPSLREFVERCCNEHGCSLIEAHMQGPRGPVTSRFLTRANGHLFQAVLPNIDPDAPLAAEMLASLCNRLDLPAHLFNLFC